MLQQEKSPGREMNSARGNLRQKEGFSERKKKGERPKGFFLDSIGLFAGKAIYINEKNTDYSDHI